jgi:hypothetical protein
VEELIPTLHQLFAVLRDKLAKSVDFVTTKTAAPLQPDWIQPELRFALVTFYVHVRRFAPVSSVEKEPERSHSEYGRHLMMLQKPAAVSNLVCQKNHEVGIVIYMSVLRANPLHR